MRSGDRRAESGTHAVRVVFICTANRARSPFAAALLRLRLDGQPVAVDSFGTIEQRGAPALPDAVRAARAFGIDLADHRARAMVGGELVGADLVIGFEQMHVVSAVGTGGASTSRMFLLTELADALELDVLPWPEEAQDVGGRIAHADSRRFARGRLPKPIADPVGGSERTFERTYAELDRLVEIVAIDLFSGTDLRIA